MTEHSANLTGELPSANRTAWRDVLLLLLAAALIGLPGLHQELDWESREVRHALIPAEMAERDSFLVPYLMGHPYIYKPAVGHVLTAYLFHVAGGPSMFLARLVSFCSGIVCVLALYGFSRLLYDRRTSVVAALMLLGIPGFAHVMRISRPDMVFGATIMTSCFLVLLGMSRKTGWQRVLCFFAAGTAFGLANLAKGPYGIFYAIFPLSVVAATPLQRKDLRRPNVLEWPAVFAGFAVFPAAWLAVAWHHDGGAYVRAVFGQHDPSEEHVRAFHWYLVKRIPILILPWTFFIPALVMRVRATRTQAPAGEASLLERLSSWRLAQWSPLVVAIVTLLAISAVPGKRDHYLGPWYPFMMLAMAATVTAYWTRPRLGKIGRILLGVSVCSVPLYFILVQPYLLQRNNPERDFASGVIERLPEGEVTVVSYKVMGEELSWIARVKRWGRVPEIAVVASSAEAANRIERTWREGRACFLVVRYKDEKECLAHIAQARLTNVWEMVFEEYGMDSFLFKKEDEGRLYRTYRVEPDPRAAEMARTD